MVERRLVAGHGGTAHAILDDAYVEVALMGVGEMQQAAAEFRVALATDPRKAESMVNLALVHKAAGRFADARELLRRAVDIDPWNPGSHYNLAVVADEGGDRTTAIEHYRAFLRFGTVTHGDLAVQVRARLAALGSVGSGL